MPDRLTAVIHQKLHFFSKSAQVITENITDAEMKNAKRKEMIPFEKIYKSATHAHDATGRIYSDIKNVKVSHKHVVTTKEEISRELESMKMTRVTREHDNLIRMLRSFAEMHRSVLGKT